MAKLLLGSVVGPQGPQGTPGVNGSQGPQGVPGPNEIAATTNVVGLTSGQLLYNNGGKVGSVDIVDNFLSIDPDKPLSANQGKVLKGLIDGNSSAIGQKVNSVNAELTGTARLNEKEIATTEVEGMVLLNGWGGGLVASRSGKIVTLNFDIMNGTIAQGTVIANLPYYFRPPSVKYGHIIGYGGINHIVQIYPDGNCSINYFASTWTNGQKIGSVSFYI